MAFKNEVLTYARKNNVPDYIMAEMLFLSEEEYRRLKLNKLTPTLLNKIMFVINTQRPLDCVKIEPWGKSDW